MYMDKFVPEFITDGFEFISNQSFRFFIFGGFYLLFVFSVIPLIVITGNLINIVGLVVRGGNQAYRFSYSLSTIKRGVVGVLLWITYVGFFIGVAVLVTSLVGNLLVVETMISLQSIVTVYSINTIIAGCVGWYLFPAAIMQFVVTGSFRQSVNVPDIVRITQEIPHYRIMYVVSVLQFGSVLIGVYMLHHVFTVYVFILLPFAVFIHTVIIAHWFGVLGQQLLSRVPFKSIDVEEFINKTANDN